MFKELALKLENAEYPKVEYWINKLRVIEPIKKQIFFREMQETYINRLLSIKNMDNILYELLSLHQKGLKTYLNFLSVIIPPMKKLVLVYRSGF